MNGINRWGLKTLLAVFAAASTSASAAIRYVNLNNPNPAPPYTNWATAANGIQNAIDAAEDGDEILVTNGVYQSGYTLAGPAYYAAHRVAINKPVKVISVNGPSVTTIFGNTFPFFGSGMRCVYMTNGAMLAGFTLTGGEVDSGSDDFSNQRGGGILCASSSAIVSNCVITGNVAGRAGGGVYSGTLINCKISGNTARDFSGERIGDGGGAYLSILKNCVITSNGARLSGGGAIWSDLENCVVASNSALQGGGTQASDLVNCTVVKNSAHTDGGVGGGVGGGVLNGTAVNCIIVQNTEWLGEVGNWRSTALTNCCTTPAPGTDGNIGGDPLFVDLAGGNFRLQSGSPCINAGDGVFVTGNVDLDGSPRIVDGTVDIGAFEFQHLPRIVLHPESQEILINSNVTFTALAVGDSPLVYRWQKDEVDLADDSRINGAFSTSLTISNLAVADAGIYRVIVTNDLGTAMSFEATLTIVGPPSISTQPTNQIVSAGTNANFSVVASGLTTLSYQWRFEESPLLNATNSLLVLTNVQSVNGGDYDVVISNSYGMTTSAVVTLTVEPSLPAFTLQPISRVASLQQPIAFSVSAKGSEPIHCQWQKNGTNLPGATNFTLNFTSVQSPDGGIYRAVLSNSVDVVFSDDAMLSVVPVVVWGKPSFLVHSIPSSATNVVAMDAFHDFSVALRMDGRLVSWGLSAPENATNLVAVALGSFRLSTAPCRLFGIDSSGEVHVWPSAYSVPEVPEAATNVVAVAAGNSGAMVLRGDGTVIAWGSGSHTNVPAAATNVVAIAAGSTHCLALRADGKVVSWGFNRLKTQDVLSTASGIVSIAADGEQVFGLTSEGGLLGFVATNSQSYGEPQGSGTNVVKIAAGMLHTLALHSDGTVAGPSNNVTAGLYVPNFLTNIVDIAAGGHHSMAVIHDPFTPIPPRIGREPMNRAVFIGETIVIHALALGAKPMKHQWNFEGALLQEQTNSWLVLTNVQLNQSGDYQLAVTNEFGSVTSVVATVTVTAPPPAIVNPVFDEEGLSITFFAFDGVEYVFEFKEHLDDSVWQQLQEITGTGATVALTDSTPLDASRFYRVRVK